MLKFENGNITGHFKQSLFDFGLGVPFNIFTARLGLLVRIFHIHFNINLSLFLLHTHTHKHPIYITYINIPGSKVDTQPSSLISIGSFSGPFGRRKSAVDRRIREGCNKIGRLIHASDT